MKVIIAGGRDFVGTDVHKKWLKKTLNKLKCDEVLSGCASGADKFGEMVAEELGLTVKKYPAEWKKYKKSAGIKRNKQMVEKADALVLFPGGKGTKNIKELATKRKLHIIENKKVK
jgi:hypothetical protein